MSVPNLELRDFTTSVASEVLIDRLDVSLSKGEVLGVFGDSGTGKTSLLHVIAGLAQRPFSSRGQILFRGQDMAGLDSSSRSKLGMSIVLQDLGLFSRQSIFENIAYPLRRRACPGDLVNSLVGESLDRFGLSGLERRLPTQVSGGQRQRVAFARALVYRPDLVLLDEPLRGLQDELRFELLTLLRSMCEDGTSIVLVSHDRDEIALVADQLVYLSKPKAIVETRQAGECFASLRRSPPAPGPDRVLSASDLVSNPGSNCETIRVIDVRELPDGTRCGLVHCDAFGSAFVQLEAEFLISPGNYLVGSGRLQQLWSKET